MNKKEVDRDELGFIRVEQKIFPLVLDLLGISREKRVCMICGEKLKGGNIGGVHKVGLCCNNILCEIAWLDEIKG
jgi:hypothetical protein